VNHDVYGLLLLDLAVILVAARVGAAVFARLGQPPVIGEVVVGILLGPTLLGDLSTTIFPLDGRPLLKALATIGVVVFMFLVGLEVDRAGLRRNARAAGAVSIGGMVVPFTLGVLLALWLRTTSYEDTDLAFVLFMGVAMSITAFPVLVRILIDRGLDQRPLGVLVIGAAAIDDVAAWLLLAGVASLATADDAWGLALSVVLAVLFGVAMVAVVRPRLRPIADAVLSPAMLSMVLAGVFLSSFLTATIGIHEIFGAFFLGLVFPRGSLQHRLGERLEIVGVVFLPVFFVATGLNVDLAGVGLSGVLQFLAILVVAFGGKLGGAFLGARTQGLAPRESMAIGALMNTRGLAELIVLTVGRELGVIDDQLFSLLVVMAVVTTMATGPLLDLIRADPDLAGRGSTEPGREARDGPDAP
jgi:Kef-type K+ transport system membrane component KefB